MPYDVRRFAMVLETGLMCSVLPASAAEAQPRPQPFEIAVGTQYGLQDPERPVTPGGILASGFDLGGHSFVLEPQWTGQNRPFVDTSKPAISGGPRLESRSTSRRPLLARCLPAR